MRAFWLRRLAVVTAENIALAVTYWLVAQLGFLQGIDATRQARVVFPAVGLVLAALLLRGFRVWPGALLGSFAASISLDRTPEIAAIIAGSTTGALPLAAALLRWVDFRTDLDRVRDVAALVGLAAGVGMAVAAALRAAALLLTESTHDGYSFAMFMPLTWLSMALGILVVTPFLLTIATLRRPRRLRLGRVVEAVAALAGAGVVAWAVAVTFDQMQLLFLVFPLLTWAAWRCGVRGAASSVLIVTVVVVYAIFEDAPIAPSPAFEADIVTIEAFIATTSVATLVLAAAVAERDRTRDRLMDASVQLLGALRRLDERLQPRDTPLIDPGACARRRDAPDQASMRRPGE